MYILAIDQGTSSTKAVVFSAEGRRVASASAALRTRYTPEGRAEQDPEAIYRSVIDSVAACVQKLESETRVGRGEIACAGIANQRETFVLWDEKGPLHDAVLWQCKRSVDVCRQLKEAGVEPEIRGRTGLILDPYFSGTKITSLLRENPRVRASHDAGGAYFGTVDTWLIHRLTRGAVYATDQTNACRTLLFDIHDLDWDEKLSGILEVPRLHLPEVYPSAHRFAESTFAGIFDTPVPITGVIGDSHAALFGERCYRPGEAKATLGTGSSILINAGRTAPVLCPSAVTTIAFALPDRTDYALEGIVVSAGSILNWFQGELGLFDDPSRLDEIARSVEDTGGVCVVPAHAGLGAPFWKMDAKGAVVGLTFATSKAHLIRAALECIPYQIRAVVDAVAGETGIRCLSIRADGGISANEFVMQWLADTLGLPVHTLTFPDVTALGAALAAGVGAGIYGGIDEVTSLDLAERIRRPAPSGSGPSRAASGYLSWRRQVDRLVDTLVDT